MMRRQPRKRLRPICRKYPKSLAQATLPGKLIAQHIHAMKICVRYSFRLIIGSSRKKLLIGLAVAGIAIAGIAAIVIPTVILLGRTTSEFSVIFHVFVKKRNGDYLFGHCS